MRTLACAVALAALLGGCEGTTNPDPDPQIRRDHPLDLQGSYGGGPPPSASAVDAGPLPQRTEKPGAASSVGQERQGDPGPVDPAVRPR
jgi:hypothetical protein